MKVLRFLRPYVISIIVIIALLFVQAYADLAIPGYMSDIVNVGIQQGGVQSIAPLKLEKEDMDKLKLFMKDNDSKTVDKFYTDSKYENVEIKVLKDDISQEDTEKLEDILLTPMLVVDLMNMQQSGDISAENYTSDFSKEFDKMFQADKLPEGADIFTVISTMPNEQRLEMINQINEKMSAYESLGKDNTKQMVVGYTKELMEKAGIDTDKTQNDYILYAGVIMLGYALISAVTVIFVTLLAAKVGSGFARDMRGSVYKKVIGFSSREVNKFSNASLITRSTNDIQQVQLVVILFLRMVLYAPIVGIGALLKVMRTGPDMAWVILVAVISIIVIVVFLIAVAMPKFTILQKLVDKINLVSREIVTGLPVIRAFTREKFEEKRFDKANMNLTKTNLFVNRLMSAMMPLMMLLMNGISVLIIWVGAGSVDKGTMQVGDLLAFIQYAMQIIIAFLMISMMSIMLPRAMVSMKRINEVLETETTVKDPDEKDVRTFDPSKKGVVEFRDVYFRYPQAEEDVLRNISFKANKGETTAFIGSTGSGKSTLINLIPRFFDVTGGKILVDGANIKKVKLFDLRQIIGYVPQKGSLFSGTVESNIAFGPNEINEERIKKAAEIAQASDFINELQDGFKSEISQGGTNVSGGQRQRLSIARAIAKDPEIYIFDDSFSALDFKTDSALRKALNKETTQSTKLIVAQRISTVLNADKIIVLDNGEIAGMGTHKELMQNCEVYQQIAASQLSKEELQ